MDIYGILALILGVAGILGGFVPVLPGPPLSWVALLLAYCSGSAKDEISITALIVWLVISTALTVLDYILPGMLTKVTGGHKAAVRGATIGLIAGLLLTPIGMVLGSFLGAFIAELTVEKQDVPGALKAASGAFFAFILTTGLKVIFSAIILWQIIAHLFLSTSA